MSKPEIITAGVDANGTTTYGVCYKTRESIIVLVRKDGHAWCDNCRVREAHNCIHVRMVMDVHMAATRQQQASRALARMEARMAATMGQ